MLGLILALSLVQPVARPSEPFPQPIYFSRVEPQPIPQYCWRFGNYACYTSGISKALIVGEDLCWALFPTIWSPPSDEHLFDENGLVPNVD